MEIRGATRGWGGFWVREDRAACGRTTVGLRLRRTDQRDGVRSFANSDVRLTDKPESRDKKIAKAAERCFRITRQSRERNDDAYWRIAPATSPTVKLSLVWSTGSPPGAHPYRRGRCLFAILTADREGQRPQSRFRDPLTALETALKRAGAVVRPRPARNSGCPAAARSAPVRSSTAAHYEPHGAITNAPPLAAHRCVRTHTLFADPHVSSRHESPTESLCTRK